MNEPVNEYRFLAGSRYAEPGDDLPEYLRKTLLWLTEKVLAAEKTSPSMMPDRSAPCMACGHSRGDHAVGGDADNPTPWPCSFPQSRGGPAVLCYCDDYTTPTEDNT